MFDTAAHLIGCHVVQQYPVSPGTDRFIQFCEIGHFNFDVETGWPMLNRSLHSRTDATNETQMIALNENPIIQSQAVVLTSPHSNRVLLKTAQARGGFAGVKEFRFESRQFALQPAREGGNAA